MEKKQSLLTQRKRITIVLSVFVIIFLLLIVRVAWIQIVRGNELSDAAIDQQTSDNTVSAKRGTIYDRNMQELAVNISVETISITPANVRDSIKNRNLTIDYVAKGLAEILDIKKEDVAKAINKESRFEYIKKKVEKDVADRVREYITENKIGGVSFVEDVKRYYPYNNLASHVIGFAGSDNQGLEGIESVYDQELSGVPGRVISTRQNSGMEMGGQYESYVAAQDGKSVVLTIDEKIQHFVEKHLENAWIENKCAQGAASIVMDVNTGEILAMATRPDYDLNKPFEITDPIKQKYEGIEEELEKLEGKEYNELFNKAIQTVRRNKAVVDSYEPGSTFKSVVASIALETGSCSLEDTFTCGGSIQVQDWNISCANHNGHGLQKFAQAVQNSCNPAFIQIGRKIGTDAFSTGIKAFGFFEQTGIELPGEATGIWHNPATFGEVDLATSSFGQSFNVTPLQLITAVSAIANGGTLLKPHLIKEIVNSDMSVVSSKDTEVVRQVISKETSTKMREIMESVVTDGGGKNAYLAGFRVAGKTGTSEKQPRGNQKYIASFIGFAPADDPQVVCLVLLDEPNGFSYYGGQIAAPVVKNILEETLQYLEVDPVYNEEEQKYVDIEVPDITGMTKDEATSALQECGLKLKVKGSGEKIMDQIPKPHTKLSANSSVVGYLEDTKVEKTVEVPNVIGESVANATALISGYGLNSKISGVAGSGFAICSGQSPKAGTLVEPGTVIVLSFSYNDAMD